MEAIFYSGRRRSSTRTFIRYLRCISHLYYHYGSIKGALFICTGEKGRVGYFLISFHFYFICRFFINLALLICSCSSLQRLIYLIAGLTLLEVQENEKKKTDEQAGGKRRKNRKPRQIKITNTHLKDIDLTVDYPISKKK